MCYDDLCDDADELYQQARNAMDSGLLDEAHSRLLSAWELEAHYKTAQLIAQIHLACERLAEARDWIEKSILCNCRIPQSWCLRGEICARAGDKDQAQSSLLTALDINWDYKPMLEVWERFELSQGAAPGSVLYDPLENLRDKIRRSAKDL